MSSTAVRSHLVAALEADLVGPFDASAPREELSLSPSRWYLTGFLAPVVARETEDPESDDELGNGPEDDDDEQPSAPEPEAKQKNLFPASMGLSVLLPAAVGADSVHATVTFADYVAVPREVEGQKRPKTIWQRVPQGPIPVDVPLDAATLLKGVAVPGARDVWLKGRLAIAEAPGLPPGTRALSLFVVNERALPPEKNRADEAFLFQVHLAVELEQGFVQRPNRRDETSQDWDDKVADLQFRNRFEWAVGHNVSVVFPEGAEVTRVETTWFPRHEVCQVVTREDKHVETRMEELALLPDGEAARAKLSPVVEAYSAWIEGRRRVEVDSKEREDTRDTLMNQAARACDRIREGIDLLARDPEVFEAFTLANRAMAMAARQRSPERYVDGKAPAWRLFQLAFVLLNLPALADPRHKDRETVDLIFFPTGGGKTEAYLGVIAVTLLLRRIHGRVRVDEGLGVAVFLRYTLRLLTLDQLSRAATLVCALERLRHESGGKLGDARFAVGLWVGRSATANTMGQVKEKIVEYKNSASKSASSPCPLTHCPWCGTELGRDSLTLVPPQKPEEVIVGCLSSSCPFSARNDKGGVPLVFVDEQVYRELPCFLIATVDKFAMLPWRGETGMLFGRALAREPKGRRFYGPMDTASRSATALPEGLRPPELIVQDELHLIAGPLGTMVGLYETAIEFLATWHASDGTALKPKVIASTATVRRAREQIKALFGRDRIALFPPPAVDDGETFFAEVDHKRPGRLYLGVAAPGRAMKAILLRAYVDLLCAAQKRWDPKGPEDQPADPCMTLVGYFNSLRELGGMRRLVEDDVRTRSDTIEKRVEHATPNPWFAQRRVQAEPVELTSRRSTAEIAANKARLQRPHTDAEHVDVVLASNMISVGVDIDRLGLMVVAGQPKTTSEYIQASSRVGRQHPGLVVTCFNVRKPRDRSHYERFAAYHASFYRFVEAQSLTPFSGPALERGLAGTIVAMTRLAAPVATPPPAAMNIETNRHLGDRAVTALADRAGRQPGITASRHDVVVHGLTKLGKNLLDAWDRLARRITSEAGGKLHYSPYDREKASKHMLHTVIDEHRPAVGTDDAKFAAPTSMRDVETSVHLWVERGRLGGRR